MNASRIAAFVCACAMAVSMAAPALADNTSNSKMAMNITAAPTRFSSPGVYNGPPALPVTLSMVIAGGGPSDFSTMTLIHTLAGDKTQAEVASLQKQFGNDKVNNFVTIFPFVISDSLKIAKEKGVALPSTPNPNPKDGEALAGALWAAGQTGNGFNVEVMLDRAVSHPIHIQVMDDIDAKYGIAQDADYHAVLTQAMHDLAKTYNFNAKGEPQS
jgi:hypothetical protein